MSSRKLNRQQSRRAEQSQAKKRKQLENSDRNLAMPTRSSELSSEQVGLILCRFGKHFEVEAIEGESAGKLHRCVARTNLEGLVTGDKVVWRSGADYTGVIVSRLERRSILERPDNFGRLKEVAANIDQMLIMIACEPEPQPNLIDRYLVAAELMQIDAILVLNKIDLLGSNAEKFQSLLLDYEHLGYPHCQIVASRHQDAQLDNLPDLIRDKTSIVVGQSGVGKSSLVKKLLPEANLEIGELSEHSREGTHTTTQARLFHLPDGGRLIDSPGIRDFSLWHIDVQQLPFGFVELANLVGHCKYRNCQHDKERGCALTEALDKGNISEARFESYRRIRDSIVIQQERFADQ